MIKEELFLEFMQMSEERENKHNLFTCVELKINLFFITMQNGDFWPIQAICSNKIDIEPNEIGKK